MPKIEFSSLKALHDPSKIIESFDLTFNKNKFTLILKELNQNEANGNHDWNLLFAKVASTETFSLQFDHAFLIGSYLPPEKYKEMIRFFEIKYNSQAKQHFGLNQLFESIGPKLHIRDLSSCSRSEKANILKLENPDAVYFKAIINWGITNKGKQKQSHVRNSNREKTATLIPDLYQQIKDQDISVRYQPKQPTNEKSLIQERLSKHHK